MNDFYCIYEAHSLKINLWNACSRPLFSRHNKISFNNNLHLCSGSGLFCNIYFCLISWTVAQSEFNMKMETVFQVSERLKKITWIYEKEKYLTLNQFFLFHLTYIIGCLSQSVRLGELVSLYQSRQSHFISHVSQTLSVSQSYSVKFWYMIVISVSQAFSISLTHSLSLSIYLFFQF